jgi:hypothetical protein
MALFLLADGCSREPKKSGLPTSEKDAVLKTTLLATIGLKKK